MHVFFSPFEKNTYANSASPSFIIRDLLRHKAYYGKRMGRRYPLHTRHLHRVVFTALFLHFTVHCLCLCICRLTEMLHLLKIIYQSQPPRFHVRPLATSHLFSSSSEHISVEAMSGWDAPAAHLATTGNGGRHLNTACLCVCVSNVALFSYSTWRGQTTAARTPGGSPGPRCAWSAHAPLSARGEIFPLT